MKTTSTLVAALAGVASARTINSASSLSKREVPQEKSHQNILDVVNINLKLNNPLNIVDAVFALLGNKAAAEGAPEVQNLDCLQQIVADQAFTNAKAAGDLEGQANAIVFRALERNTGSVGLESVLCSGITAVNPEIAAITQHQDPASAAGKSGNAAIELAVAAQLASIGFDPLFALQSGTFAPGEIGDPTAAGNTCDDEDPAGCINTKNLLTPAVTEADIKAAVAGAGAGAAGKGKAAGKAQAKEAKGQGKATAGAQASQADASKEAAADAGAQATATEGGVNVQTFTGDLGGAPPAVVSSQADPKRNFAVDGSTFVNAGAALQRSCAVQHTKCANGANSGSLDVSVSDCDAQQAQCNAAAGGGAAKRFITRKARLAVRQAALNFNGCNLGIDFGAGNDGRKEDSFVPADASTFNHGSALNIKVISDFICQQAGNKCDLGTAEVDACNAASKLAQGTAGGKAQASADAFNKALGF